MKKKILNTIISIILVMTIFTGCNKEEEKNDNLDFENKKETVASNENPYSKSDKETLWHIYSVNPYCTLDEIKAINEGKIDSDDVKAPEYDSDNLIYKGEDIPYRKYIENDSKIPFTYTIFMETNENIQPFKVGDEEVEYYSITLNPGESKDIQMKFSPLKVSVDKQEEIRVFSVAQVAWTKELEKTILMSPTNYGAAFIHYTILENDKLKVKADSTKNERSIKAAKNLMGEDSQYAFKDDDGKNVEDTEAGLTLGTEKFEEETIGKMINLDVKWDGKSPLYARTLCYGNYDARIYLVIDGKPVKAFNGRYYADYSTKEGVVHNMKLNSEVLPKEGSHIAYGIMIYRDKKTREVKDFMVDYPLLLHN